MKKAFDQTVRELKREVNKKVLKVPGIEQKVLDATSNEPWGPHGSHLADIAQATRNFNEYQIIMTVLWKRLNDTGKNWRHVYKALIVLEYLVAHGSERIIDEVREHAYQISTLSDFQYIDSSGRDQGTNVRKKSQSLVNIVNDKERIQEVRQKAHSNRDKYRGSTGGMYKSSSYSGAVGGYGDHYDDDKYESRYGSKNDDINGYGREKEWNYKDEDRHGRGNDPYSRDGDRYGREYDENYNRDGYRDDEYRGRSSASYHPGARSRSSDREKTQGYEEEDRYSSRSGGGRGEEYTPDERQLDRKLSAHSTGAPPSYEEVVGDTQSHVHVERDGGSVRKDAVAEVSHNETTKDSQVPTASSPNPDLTKDINEFDEFDPRGSVPAPPNSAPSVEHDFLGSLMDTNPLAIVLQEPLNTTTSTSDAFTDSEFGTPFVALSSASAVLNQPAENPFGETPFKAVEQDGAQPHNFTAATSFPATVAGDGSESLNKPDYGFGESLNGMMFTSEIPVEVSAHFPPEMQLEAQLQSQQFMQPQSQASQQPYMQMNAPAQPQPPSYMPSASLPNTQYQPQIQSQASLPPPNTQYHSQLQSQSSLPPPNAQYQPQIQSQSSLPPQFSMQSQQSVDVLANLGLQPMQQMATSSQPTGAAVMSYASQPQAQKDKFEPKSAVWADTINRGLVNLNISGTKVNPLADIGIDFDALNRKEKRREKEKAVPTVSTTTMGKAMGSGSGVGRAGATGIAPPANPMVGAGMNMGMGMGMGGAGAGMGVGGVGVGMGGYGAGMNQSMGMGGYPQQPYGNGMGNMGMAGQMRPPMGMPPSGQGMAGYNPSMGMGGYPQQPYGGYR